MKISSLLLLLFIVFTHVLATWPIINIRRRFKIETDERNIKKLIEALEGDFTHTWMYKDLHSTPDQLGVTEERVEKALSNVGNEQRLNNLLLRALQGEEVKLVVIGGSISKGAPFSEEGKGNMVYFNAIEDWWNKVIGSVTQSSMSSDSIAIGGVGTDYFSYCLQTHLEEDNKAKLILWELSANDRGRYDSAPFPPGQPLEQFTRNVLTRVSKPTLMYIHFFRGQDYMGGQCKNCEDEGGDTIASHYNITSLSWRNFVRDSMVAKESLFLEKSIFADDRLHPSILGHAQMAYLIINHLKKTFLKFLKQSALDITRKSKQGVVNEDDIELPDIMYRDTSTGKPLCFTYFKYNSNEPKDSLSVEYKKQDGYRFNIFKQFKIREDKLGGMQTKLAQKELQVAFDLPTNYSKLAIITHGGTGGAQISLDSFTPVLVETDNYTMGTKLQVIRKDVKTGEHVLNVKSMNNGFALCGIAVI